MLTIGDNLSKAVRAAVVLPPADRAEFVGKHLRAQAAGEPPPTPKASEGSKPPSREQLQKELQVLADTLTAAVNEAARKKGHALHNVAELLLSQSVESTPAADTSCTDTAPAAAEAAGPAAAEAASSTTAAGPKGKKTARFASGTAGPERVGEPPPVMSKTYTGEKDIDGMPHGQGRAEYANGDVYEGGWKLDRRDGYGTCKYASGEEYTGEWKADKREGKGTAKYVTGDVYEGEWRFGKREGHGRANYASRDGYEGQWKADKKQGFGTFWSASGEVYEGQWLTGTYEGRGTYLYASSDVYEGEYRAGKRDGRGVYMYAGGDVYEGEYKDGKMEGRGTYRLADGTAEVGRYFAGADVGEGARWSSDRKTAYRLRGGKVEEEISLEEAERIAGVLGLVVPPIFDPEAEDEAEADGSAPLDVSDKIVDN